MSYTYKVKEEILANEVMTDVEKMAEISAIILSKNGVCEKKIELKLENIGIAKRIFKIIKNITNLKLEIKYSTSKKLGEHNVYIIVIHLQNGYREFVKKIKEFTVDEIIKEDERLKGFIRGIFLSCGYIKSPEKEYALDFFMDSNGADEMFFEILKRLNKKAFKTVKRGKPLIYLRNSEDIMDIMVILGCLQSFFKYEETTMIKELKNKTIREMNYEVANETKTLNTGLAQIKMINYIEREIGLNSLTEVLEEIANVRLKNPESTLQEIGDIIGISKSGVRNRFRRIEEIYNNLIVENGE